MTFDLYDFDMVLLWKFPSPFHHSSQSLFWLFPYFPLLVLTGSMIHDLTLLAVHHYTL